MNRIDVLILRRLSSRIGLVIAVLFGLFALAQTLDIGQSQRFYDAGGPLVVVTGIAVLAFDAILTVLPSAVLIGTIIAVLDLQARREMVAIKATGLSIWRLLRAPLLLALVTGGLVIFVIGPAMILARANLPLSVIPTGATSNLWIEQNGADGPYVLTAENATARGEGVGVQFARWTTALLFNGLGRYEDARVAAQQASDAAPELFISHWALESHWALAELVEACVRSGNSSLAAEALERLVEAPSASGTDWGLGIVARSRALVSEDEAAEPLYLEAITRLGRTPLRPELARAHLVYGEWLRRENRRVDARGQLRTAYEMFISFGADAFAERTRRELLATGEKVRKRSDETRGQLTAQEEQIARLAADGQTNQEIGAQLFLSPRTVEWHLHKVFTKLGITSRMQLRDKLPDAARVGAPA